MPTPVQELERPRWPYDLQGSRSVPDLSALPREEAERARARLERLHRACGCALGATLAFAALGAYVALLAIWAGWLADGVWVSVGVGAAVFVLAAGAGKTLGLMRARMQRDRLIDQLHWRIATRETGPIEPKEQA